MYRTCIKEASKEYEEKKSVFIGQIKRVYTEKEAKEFIDKTRKKHREASHNPFAYTLGEKKLIMRYSDDGEPQGTAGMPILTCINNKDITDVVVVVTRYFGGTLLGAGGLVRAYTKASSLVIDESGIIEVVEGVEIGIVMNYDLLGKFQHSFSENEIHIENIVYTDKVKIICLVEARRVDFIKKIASEISNGKCGISAEEEKKYFKSGNRLFLNLSE